MTLSVEDIEFFSNTNLLEIVHKMQLVEAKQVKTVKPYTIVYSTKSCILAATHRQSILESVMNR